MDGIEHAAGGAQTAADAAVGIHYTYAAAQAAAGLCFDLLLGKGKAVMLKGFRLRLIVQNRLAGRTVEAVDIDKKVFLIQFVELAEISAAGQALAVLYKAVQ